MQTVFSANLATWSPYRNSEVELDADEEVEEQSCFGDSDPDEEPIPSMIDVKNYFCLKADVYQLTDKLFLILFGKYSNLIFNNI